MACTVHGVAKSPRGLSGFQFLSVDTINVLGRIRLCWCWGEARPVLCKMFSPGPGPYPLDANSTHSLLPKL